MRYRRKLNTGNHGAIISGQRRNIRPGDLVECEPEELGSEANNYEEVAVAFVEKHRNKPGFVVIDAAGKKHPPTGCLAKEEAEKLAKELTAGGAKKAWQIEAERITARLRLKSPWLTPPKPGGHPGNLTYLPNDLPGLRQELATKQSEAFNPEGQAVGEKAAAKARLKAAWAAWKYQVEIDPLGRHELNDPQDGQHVEAIGLAAARLAVLEEEIVEIKARLKAATKTEAAEATDEASRLRWMGRYKCSMDRKIISCDGRAVIYEDNKPLFADNRESVTSYLEQCQNHQREQAKAKQARRDAERAAEKVAV